MIEYNVTKAFLFQINADLWIFLFIKESRKKNDSTVLNIDNNNNNNNKCFSFANANQHIRMISEGSCDTEDWSNDAENSALITEINLKYIQIVILNSKNISQYYCFYCILDKINAGLVSRREFFKKKNLNLTKSKYF